MKEFIEAIEEARTILLLTHINPDADTIGSALGMYHTLVGMGKKVWCYTPSPLPYNLSFLPKIEKFRSELPQSSDLWISFDCASFDRTALKAKERPLINFDHHQSNTYFGDINIVDPRAPSTSKVVFDTLKQSDLFVSKEAALCFYTALVDDCGFFRYEGVDRSTFEFAAELCGLGVDASYVAWMLTMREPLAKLRLIGRLLNDLELKLDAQVAIIRLTQQLLRATGATKEMAESALDMARSLATVEVALLLREEEDGATKVSLRSKRIDVSRIARFFGGGGHKRAAGFTVRLEFDKVLREVLEKIGEELEVEKKR